MATAYKIVLNQNDRMVLVSELCFIMQNEARVWLTPHEGQRSLRWIRLQTEEDIINTLELIRAHALLLLGANRCLTRSVRNNIDNDLSFISLGGVQFSYELINFKHLWNQHLSVQRGLYAGQPIDIMQFVDQDPADNMIQAATASNFSNAYVTADAQGVLYDSIFDTPVTPPTDEQHAQNQMHAQNHIREDYSTDSSSSNDYSSSDSDSDDESSSDSESESIDYQTGTCLICYQTFLAREMIFASCGSNRHAICTTCFPKYVANFTSPPISTQHPYVKCVGDGCSGCYAEKIWEKYITPAEATRVRTLINRCRNENHVECHCPKCEKIINVGSELIRNQPQSTVMICCNHCNWLFCYHCLEMMSMQRLHELFPNTSLELLNSLFVTQDSLTSGHRLFRSNIVESLYNSSSTQPLCIHCERHGCAYAKRPGEFNRYMLPIEIRKAPKPVLLRNLEIDQRTLEYNVQRILDGVNLSQCSRCRHGLHRTTQCHELSHCGYKSCETCGYRSADFESYLIDHFVQRNHIAKACPTFPHDDWWNHFVGTENRCREGVCHTDTCPCTVPEHAKTRERILQVRITKHLMSLHASLPQPWATKMMHLVLSHPKGADVVKMWARMHMSPPDPNPQLSQVRTLSV